MTTSIRDANGNPFNADARTVNSVIRPKFDSSPVAPNDVAAACSLPYRVISLATNNAANIKNAAGCLLGFDITNTAANMIFVKLYNKATAPNPASDTPVMTIGVADWKFENLSGFGGIAFPLGIGIAIVTGSGDTNNTAVGAGDAIVHIYYA